MKKPVFVLPESPKVPLPRNDKIKHLESLLINSEANRQSMGGGEILRMILMDSKQYVDNSDPVRPKTGMQARDLSEIDSLIMNEQADDDQP
jgi:hypothetical protein